MAIAKAPMAGQRVDDRASRMRGLLERPCRPLPHLRAHRARAAFPAPLISEGRIFRTKLGRVRCEIATLRQDTGRRGLKRESGRMAHTLIVKRMLALTFKMRASGEGHHVSRYRSRHVGGQNHSRRS
jgi:hypothetical protein